MAVAALAVGGWLTVTGLNDAAATPPVPGAHVTASARTPASTPADAAPGHAGTASPAASAPLAASRPVRVRIPAAGVDTGPLLELGLAPDGTVQVPSEEQADLIGWYREGVTPGQTGPAVLIGHYDTARGPAVMRDVTHVEPGDTITVDRADGSTAVFGVTDLQQVDKKHFPTQRVYGDTAAPELRLITCGGDLRGGHRPDNIILYADLIRTSPPRSH
ncbi:class F sortase [Streptomyces sp. DSM 40712]|uniref:Class F sortase n=1 Tax=Streptomyces lancefieldiae TaxID=3075520 RepID=A0ABU3ATW8_9ACTN|nr:class F sortase [Streptomyces sp. DSM 40712]MDT0613628.1 class F sortase [Streptomyces sp. DSM 40712]